MVSCDNKTNEESESINEKNQVFLDASFFPDEAFRVALCRLFPIAEGDAIPKEILKLKQLDLNNQGIKSLKGIEYFKRLEHLDCRNNLLTEIDFSKNSNLISFDCGHNQIKNIDVSKNTSLEALGCSNNQLTSIDVTNNPNLSILICNSNNIDYLNLAYNPKLTELGVNDCKMKSLDVSCNPDLEELYCNNNKIKELDLRMNKKIKNLYCKQFKKIKIITSVDNPNIVEGNEFRNGIYDGRTFEVTHRNY